LRGGGQAVVTTTELAHVPGAEDPDVTRVAIAEGRVMQAAAGAVAAEREDERGRGGDAAPVDPAEGHDGEARAA
jgi:hypothetical protein